MLAGSVSVDWASRVTALWFFFIALGELLNLDVLLTGFAMGITAGVLPMIPGGVGIQEGSMAGLYALLGVPLHQAVRAAIYREQGGTMNRQMPRRVAIWIDHREAILITFRGEQVTRDEELFSEVGPHTHGGGWAQHRIEAHRHELLKHYYEEVIQHLGPVDEILILGPGQAKHELHQSIEHHKGLRGKVMAVNSASRLTEQEVIAEAEQFFESESREPHS